MPTRDWRSPEAYKPLQTADAMTFAWEALQRNPAFQDDVKRLEQQQLDAEPEEKEASESAFAVRWGLRFRR